MISSPEDRKIDEVYHELDKEITDRRKKEKSWVNKLTPKMKLGIIVALAAGIWYVTNHQVSFGKILLWGGGFVIAIVLFLSGEDEPRKLTEEECARSLFHKLKKMQRFPLGDYRRIPLGRIAIDFVGREMWLNGKPWKREISFHIIDEKNLKKTYSGEVNVWDGDIIGVKKRYGGFTGFEARDVSIIPSKVDRFEKERDRYLGKKRHSV